MKKSIIFIFSVIAVIFTFFGCKKQSSDTSTTEAPGLNEVWLQNTAFIPGSLTVAVNTTIKWTNKDGFVYTVSSNSALFESGNISSGGTFSHQFTTAGIFQYHCSIHPSMTGTVIVQ